MSHEIPKVAGSRRSLSSKAICAAPPCEALTPRRGRRPHHVRRDRVGTWETSSGPLSRLRSGPRQEAEEAKLPWNRRGVGRVHSTAEALEQARDERRRRVRREGTRSKERRVATQAPGAEPGEAWQKRLAHGSVCVGNPITSDLRQEPGAGKPHAGICAGGGQQWLSLPRPFNFLAVVASANEVHCHRNE